MNTMITTVRRGIAGGMTAVSTFLVLGVTNASAQSSQAITLTDPLGGKETFSTVATAVAGFLFWDVAAPLSVIMVLVGAFQLITSAGEPEKVSQGRKTLTYAAIGLIVALIAGGIVSIIQGFITGSSS